MLYENKYPAVRAGDEPETCLAVFAEYKPCEVCRARTRFMDIDFEAYLCSEECHRKLIKEYLEAANGN